MNMFKPIYFRITEPVRPENPDLFDQGWTEIPATTNPLELSRKIWRSNEVSRDPQECATVQFNIQQRFWEFRNNSSRIVILTNEKRNEVGYEFAIPVKAGSWQGTITGAFSFELTHDRPDSIARILDEIGHVPYPNKTTLVWEALVERAKQWLRNHYLERLGLAYLWRQHLTHTVALPEDTDTAVVASAFTTRTKPLREKNVTRWREDLARFAYGESGHQQAVRDLVVNRIMDASAVAAADAWVQDHGTPPAGGLGA